MIRKFIIPALVFSLLLPAMLLADVTYEIDTAHSKVGFDVKHMVITTVDGKFNKFDADFKFNKDNLDASAIGATIQVASVDTDNQKRDDHLRSADFFDAETYPTITFKSTKIEKKDDGYVAHGDLTIRGVTKTVALPFNITGEVKDPWGNTRIGVEADLTVNRQDFNVSWSKTLDGGGLVVSDQVNIKIAAEFIKKGDA